MITIILKILFFPVNNDYCNYFLLSIILFTFLILLFFIVWLEFHFKIKIIFIKVSYYLNFNWLIIILKTLYFLINNDYYSFFLLLKLSIIFLILRLLIFKILFFIYILLILPFISLLHFLYNYIILIKISLEIFLNNDNKFYFFNLLLLFSKRIFKFTLNLDFVSFKIRKLLF